MTGKFVCSYIYEGIWRSIDIPAHSWDEAEAVVKAIRESLIVDGELIARGEVEGTVQ